jgi:exopolysaccharide production protein ExoZ
MQTAQDQRIYSLQGLRFVAALMVLHMHAAQTAFESTGSSGIFGYGFGIFGRAGVDIFFVISGAIIARSAPTHTPSAFIRGRIIRILPLYYLWCIPSLLSAASRGIGWRELLATALWPATDRMSLSVLPVAWTLSFEILFYAAAALVLIDRRLLWLLLTLYLGAFALRPLGPPFQFLGNPIILEFLAGAAITYLPALRWAWLGIPLGFLILVLGGIFVWPPHGDIISFLEGKEALIRLLDLGIPSVMIVLGTMQVRLSKGWLSYLGDASYSLYLSHSTVFLIISAGLGVAPFHVPADLVIVGGIAISVLFGWRVYELVEKPLLSFLRRRTAAPAVSSKARMT